jgi:hypothetical protein
VSDKPVILKPERKVPFGFRKDVEQPDQRPVTCTNVTTEKTWQPHHDAPASPRAIAGEKLRERTGKEYTVTI